MDLSELRKEYLNKSINHCQEVIKDFIEELSKEDDDYLKEIIIEVIEIWEKHKDDYLFLLSEI